MPLFLPGVMTGAVVYIDTIDNLLFMAVNTLPPCHDPSSIEMVKIHIDLLVANR